MPTSSKNAARKAAPARTPARRATAPAKSLTAKPAIKPATQPATKPGPTVDARVLAFARQLRGWADTVISVTGSAVDVGLTLAQARTNDPKTKAALTKAGSQLKNLRESTGLTTRELGEAIGLGDATLLDKAEGGLAALPMDVVLRLAGVLGRHDPLPVALALTRQHQPELWKTLEALGIGRLALQGSRERELANIYRGNDAARELDDAQFAQVLAFTRKGFDMAVDFAAAPPVKNADKAKKATPSKR